MTIFQRLSTVVVALFLSLSPAFGVSVQLTHTGTLDFLDYVGPVAATGPTIRHGDAFTISYRIDVDRDQTFIDCLADPTDCTYGYSEFTDVDISTSSGFKTRLPNINYYLDEFRDSAGASYMDILGGTADISIYLATYPIWPSGIFQLPDDQFANALNSMGRADLYLDVKQSVIGYSEADCAGTCFFGARGDVVTTATLVTLPPEPPITPVPVPAPFAMLGMAMLGLFGFGRRARA